MKKYLRLILEVLLGICLVATATLAYLNYSGKKHMAATTTPGDFVVERAFVEQ